MEGRIKVNKRIAYAAATMLIMVVEVLMALFVRDEFIRPYVGDMLVEKREENGMQCGGINNACQCNKNQGFRRNNL